MKDIRERAFEFAVRIVKKICQFLDEQPGVARTLSKQLIRSGTSIGANLEEAQAGQSKADFISKNAIALKEVRETYYWLRLLSATDILPESRIQSLQIEAEEIMKIIGAIVSPNKKVKGKSMKSDGVMIKGQQKMGNSNLSPFSFLILPFSLIIPLPNGCLSTFQSRPDTRLGRPLEGTIPPRPEYLSLAFFEEG